MAVWFVSYLVTLDQ